MPIKQTNLFQKEQIPHMRPDEKAFQWLNQHGFSGYNGKYKLYTRKQLYQLLQWNVLYGNFSAEKKEYLINVMQNVKKSNNVYFHFKSITDIIGYSKWLIIKIFRTECERINHE